MTTTSRAWRDCCRVFHQPQKRGAVIRREPALGGNPEIRCAPVWDPEARVWKLWTICITPEELHGIAGLSGYHESRDGLHWYQPILEGGGVPGNAREQPRLHSDGRRVYGRDPGGCL